MLIDGNVLSHSGFFIRWVLDKNLLSIGLHRKYQLWVISTEDMFSGAGFVK